MTLVGIGGSSFLKIYDALSTFKTFKNEVGKKKGKVVKVLGSNNSGKLISCDFTKYCEHNGIKR
jgi:hypothetical protein